MTRGKGRRSTLRLFIILCAVIDAGRGERGEGKGKRMRHPAAAAIS